jgi:pyrroline-5-carboxylate reductase
MQDSLAVIGFGNMGSAVIAGAHAAKAIDPRRVVVIEPDPARRAEASALGCVVSEDLAAARDADQVLLSVKPQMFATIAPALGARARRTVFISIMAGLGSATIRRALGDAHAVVRAMPNTPCRIGAGITAIALGAGAAHDDASLAERLFAAVGRVVRVDERMLDAVTATSGSGPAYVFLVAEAWEDAAVALGFERRTARELVRQTLLGAARMLDDGNVEAAALREAVTSKGGTTAAALGVFQERGLRDAFRDALAAAERRGRELGS